jgi:hypothetical protein
MTSIRSVISEPFIDYETTVTRCMDIAGALNLLGDGRPIMLKPNLVNDSPHLPGPGRGSQGRYAAGIGLARRRAT